jgi:hypothetical protein
MHPIFRRRFAFIWLLPFFVMAWFLFRDPDHGVSTEMWSLRVLSVCAAIALAHWWHKGIFDYPEADRQTLFRMAGNGPTGAGLALIAHAIIFFTLVWAFVGNARAADLDTRIPDRARQYLPLLHQAQATNWANAPRPEWLAALVEHESGCFTMPRKCWNPLSRLKTAREEGAGLGQITRAYRPDGSVRFDALADLRDRHPALREWTWENVFQRPDLQLTAVTLQLRDNWMFFMRLVPDKPMEALYFADAAYNGGAAGVQNDRRACGASRGCDPHKWFGNVELHCTKSHAALYGTRSACDINRFHVADVRRRAPKYRGLV